MYSLSDEITLNEAAKTLEAIKFNLSLIGKCGKVHLERALVSGGDIRNNSLKCLNELNELIEAIINKGK